MLEMLLLMGIEWGFGAGRERVGRVLQGFWLYQTDEL